MLSGSAKDPCFQDSEPVKVRSGSPQPSDWLGEGYAVKMDTKAKNTPSADWRLVLRTVTGERHVFFIQNKYKVGVKNLSTTDVQERFLALKAAFIRCGVHANTLLLEELS